ncbi:SPOR domain-containing protein [Thalassospira sp.]|uniref:SPOR domain-containing protein n=1 Tax=Thalassospira sp. TaxID=1912094 RepID=UPI0027328B77|nr:SPOR domain-containing protein [Thalassospira sp.]MDP2698014.1 SPOR domain-containing protein [Thalassospira sp.]
MQTIDIFPNKKRPINNIWLAIVAVSALSACGSDGSLQTRADVETEQTTAPAMTSVMKTESCGLFLGTEPAISYSGTDMSDELGDVKLSRTAQQNLERAISLDLTRQNEKSRQLYLWLTAASPDQIITIDCGNGLMLSGAVARLAQQRLTLLDQAHPELAESSEIQQRVQQAVVEQSPTTPTPPVIERNRDFYQSSGPFKPVQENSAARSGAMTGISANTAMLTSIPPRHDGTGATSSTDIPETSAPAPAKTAPIISTSRPVEDGTLEPVAMPPVTRTAEMPAAAPETAQMTSGSYYAIQLAAYRSRERAENSWITLQKSARGALDGIDHEVQSLTIPGQGLFFRLLTGRFGTSGDAAHACDGLKRDGIDCMVRKVEAKS